MNRHLSYSLSLICTGLLLGAMSISGCGGAEEEPEMVFGASDSLLVEVLVDLHHTDAELYAAVMGTDSTDAEGFSGRFKDRSKRDSILAVHGLDEATFTGMLDGLLAEPDRFLMLYNHVLDRSADR